MGSITVIGIGPGKKEYMTQEAIDALKDSDLIVGYTTYINILDEEFKNKEILSTPMRQEEERVRLCLLKAKEGFKVALVCSGDAGVYGLASLVYEMSIDEDVDINVISGVTAANSGAAILGAPLNHDFCVISLSDLLTPWELIENRLIMAAKGDFCIALYNPSSNKRPDYLMKACDILLNIIEAERPCGWVKNIGRNDTESRVCSLKTLRDEKVDMFTTVFIGNSNTKIINGKLVTPRGYLKGK